MSEIVLHSYWRATAPYRVRIGLALKGLAYDYVPVDLVAGEQGAPSHAALNAQRLVPALETEDGVLTQSLAILEWLEETHPEPPLLPADAAGRARVRAMAAIVATDIHPLNNLRVLKALDDSRRGRRRPDRLGGPLDQRWLRGAGAHGRPLGRGLGVRCDADVRGLLPHPAGLQRRAFRRGHDALPGLAAVAARAADHPAFQAAHPDRQPDAR
jgi:maleylacetoacetate isomerase/maleylpyruvate isomerase